MSSVKLNKIGNFLKYWKDAILYAGYNSNGIECFYIIRGQEKREIPHSWEYITDQGMIQAWNNLKKFLDKNFTIAYDYKSDCLVHDGFFGG